MSDQKKKLDITQLIDEDKVRRQKKQELKEKFKDYTFRKYLELILGDSKIVQNASARLLEMIEAAGTVDIPEDEREILLGPSVDEDEDKDNPSRHKRYKFFSEDLYGIDGTIQAVVEHIKAGAYNLSNGKKLLVLVGPPSSGKSTMLTILKRGVDHYDLRPVFRIVGCPINEEPLHLLSPDSQRRAEVSKAISMKIEGDLCPTCRHLLRTKYTDPDGTVRWWDIPVEVFTFSLQGGRGIGVFEPGDDLTETITNLTGQPDIAVLSAKGPNDPKAFSLESGEIGKSNRGLFEGVELLRANPKVMRVFFSAAEEKVIKVQGSPFPHISIDTVFIGHTNLQQFKDYSTNKGNEGLHQRISPVYCPYTMRIADEVRIYRKLIQRESPFMTLRQCHIAPGSLELAALFAIMTRLSKSTSEISLLTKAKLYNGDVALTELKQLTRGTVDLRTLREEGQLNDDLAKREGMHGLGSRDILTALNNALVKEGEASGCLTPLRTISALGRLFDNLMGLTPEDVTHYKELLTAEDDSVFEEYQNFVEKAVQKAFLTAYSQLARTLFNDYINEIQYYCELNRKFTHLKSGANAKRDLAGNTKDPNEKLMRSIEEQGGIADSQKDGFRSEILTAKATIDKFGYDTYRPLAEMVEQKLLEDSRQVLTAVLSTDKPRGNEEQQRVNDLFGNMEANGFCKVCARETVKKAQEFFDE